MRVRLVREADDGQRWEALVFGRVPDGWLPPPCAWAGRLGAWGWGDAAPEARAQAVRMVWRRVQGSKVITRWHPAVLLDRVSQCIRLAGQIPDARGARGRARPASPHLGQGVSGVRGPVRGQRAQCGALRRLRARRRSMARATLPLPRLRARGSADRPTTGALRCLRQADGESRHEGRQSPTPHPDGSRRHYLHHGARRARRMALRTMPPPRRRSTAVSAPHVPDHRPHHPGQRGWRARLDQRAAGPSKLQHAQGRRWRRST